MVLILKRVLENKDIVFDNTFFGGVFLVLKHMLENKGCVLEFFFGGGV